MTIELSAVSYQLKAFPIRLVSLRGLDDLGATQEAVAGKLRCPAAGIPVTHEDCVAQQCAAPSRINLRLSGRFTDREALAVT